MLLSVREAARLLGCDEEELYRRVDDAEIPFHEVDGQAWFNRTELLEWATDRGLPVAPEAFRDPDRPDAPSLASALAAGGVHHDVPGGDRLTALRGAVACMPLAGGLDRELLLQVLLAREKGGTTAVGDGIAIPHVRSPVVQHRVPPSITLCHLAAPADFAAADGKPVHTLFCMTSPTVPGHLQLLARLAAGLRDARFRAAVLRRAGADELLAEARRVDAGIDSRGGTQPPPARRSAE
jgi:PTS system nitrogen regulatory IIA component